MSFDVYLEPPECPTCHQRLSGGYEFNYAHNTNSIVDICLKEAGNPVAKRRETSYCEWSWGRLDGWTAAEALPILEKATEIVMDPSREAELKALEPPNGWGSLTGVRECFRKFLAACREFPETTIRTWG